MQPAVRIARHRDYPPVELGRRPLVQRELALAGGLSKAKGREVHIGELDRALQLEGAAVGEEDMGNMGRDDLDTAFGPVSLLKEGDDVRLYMFGVFELRRIVRDDRRLSLCIVRTGMSVCLRTWRLTLPRTASRPSCLQFSRWRPATIELGQVGFDRRLRLARSTLSQGR